MKGTDEPPRRLLIIQTAFLGDVILTLPLIQVVKKLFPDAEIDLVTAPRGIEPVRNHPAVSHLIEYDKRGKDSGMKGFFRIRQKLLDRKYDIAIIPHRSMRSAALAFTSGIPVRIGFDRSAGRLFLTATIPYKTDRHEYRRNLDLLAGIGKSWNEVEYPRLHPSENDAVVVSQILLNKRIDTAESLVAIAPGTLWNTKRWPQEHFTQLARSLRDRGHSVMLIGGPEDEQLCRTILSEAGGDGIYSVAGKLTVLQSSELLRWCKLLICNDSAPLHIAVAAGTPVVAIFGATIPAYGFGPYGPNDRIVEKNGLPCRPCSIHGGPVCPIGTFECMKGISSDEVLQTTLNLISQLNRINPATQ